MSDNDAPIWFRLDPFWALIILMAAFVAGMAVELFITQLP
jgi:hypothetical protein